MPTRKTNLQTQENKRSSIKRKRTKLYLGIGLFSALILCITLFPLHNPFTQDPMATSSYETRIKNALNNQDLKQQKEELTLIQKELTNDISTTEKEISTIQVAIEHAETLKKNLPTLSSAIDNTQDIMFQAQEHALNIGKFTCKVNSCQNDPSHENYPAFIKATDDLVEAKNNLQKAKDTYQNAKQSVSSITDNQAKVKQLHANLTQLNKEKQTIENTYLTK